MSQRIDKEIVRWFSEVLSDTSIQRLDDLKNGAHLVQLIHSLNPLAFDLSRCDFLASTAYHYEKNFKLLQAVTPKELLPPWFVMERVMEGEKQRELFRFCSHVKQHYYAWRSQIATNGGLFPKKEMYGEYVFLPSGNKNRASAGSVNNNNNNDDGGQPAASPLHMNAELVRVAQETYDAVVERSRAKEKRKIRSRPRGDGPNASETLSARSGSTAKSVRSAFQVAAGTVVLSKFVGGQSISNTSNIENWAQQVQSPTRGLSPTDGANSPTQAEGESVLKKLNGECSNHHSTQIVAHESPVVPGFSPPPELVPLAQPPSFSAASATPPPATSAHHADAPALRYSMNYFACLKTLRPWSIISVDGMVDGARSFDDACHPRVGPSSQQATSSSSPDEGVYNEFVTSLAAMSLSEIRDTDGEGIACAEFVPLEELLRRKAAGVGSQPKSKSSRTNESIGGIKAAQVVSSPSESTVSMGPSRQSTTTADDAWDAFDDLVMKSTDVVG